MHIKWNEDKRKTKINLSQILYSLDVVLVVDDDEWFGGDGGVSIESYVKYVDCRLTIGRRVNDWTVFFKL